MEKDSVFNDRYKILGQLGKGGFGQVYKVYDSKRNLELAMKVDLNSRGSTLLESKILHDIQGGEGIPKLYDSGKSASLTYMVIELLGQNLNSIRKSLNGFSLNTVMLIFLQCLIRIEYIHSCGYIHRDIKPQQFLIGPKDIIYLVDYGISKKYIIDGNHMSFQSQCMRAGSCSYASVNSHIGIRLSRRDDLEGLMYMIIFLAKGVLPWQTKGKVNNNRKWQVVFAQKRAISDEELFFGLPKQLQQIFSYVKNLKFDEKPNYAFIRDVVQNMRNEYTLKSKNFDWKVIEKSSKCLDKRKTDEDNTKTLHGRKNTKKRHTRKINRQRAMATMINLPLHRDSHEAILAYLQPPISISKSLRSAGQDASSYSSGGETIKNYLPEFVHREQIFEELHKFRVSFVNSN